MFKWILGGIFLSLTGLVVYLFLYLGLYKSPEIHGVIEPEFWLLYKSHKGAYHQISPVLSEVESLAQKASITCLDTFAIFLDDPKALDPDRLRSELGCLTGQEIFIAPDGLSRKKWAPGKSLHLSFDGSPSISPFKVYPAAQDWFERHRKKMGIEVMEVYSIDPRGNFTTHYYFPLKTEPQTDKNE